MTVTWNGTTITGPVLIFQDELVTDDRTNVLATPMDGTVICTSENQAQVGWHLANGVLLQASETNHFRLWRTSSSATPSVSRLTTNRPDEALTSAEANGLWTCRLNGGFSTAVPLGIYARGGGEKFLYGCMWHNIQNSMEFSPGLGGGGGGGGSGVPLLYQSLLLALHDIMRDKLEHSVYIYSILSNAKKILDCHIAPALISLHKRRTLAPMAC